MRSIVHAMQPTLSITTSEELAHGLDLLANSDYVALDTEFMRESTYYAGLCLIQAAAADCCMVIDPLALADLQPLWTFLADRKRVKVLHAARQDLEVMTQAMSASLSRNAAPGAAANSDARPQSLPLPGPIFDTQIAAAMLGSSAQIGYGNLVTERLGHTLPKGQTRTNWAQRPLTPEQLEYAADDVRYLAPLYLNLRDALQAAGRLHWLEEETAELEDPRLYRVEAEDAWRRLKGMDRLQPEQRAAAKLLAGWRETRAMLKDKPRGWILADEFLRDIAERLPQSAQELQAIDGLGENFIRKSGDAILALVAQGRENAATEAPATTSQRPEPQQLARVSGLLALVRSEAQRLGLAPELLATRRDAEQLVFSGRTDHLLRGWRREVIGEQLVALAAT